jgi:hypothetical protein
MSRVDDEPVNLRRRAISYELGQPFPNVVGNFREISVTSFHCRAGSKVCVQVLVDVTVFKTPNEMPLNLTISVGAFPGVDSKPVRAVRRLPLIADARV